MPHREALGGRFGLRTADGLLGRDPGALSQPAAAGAVHGRAVEAHEVGHQPAPLLVVDQGGGAAARLGVVLGRGVAPHASLPGDVAVLAVAHQAHVAAAPAAEGGHAVEGQRRGVAVRHRRAAVAEGHVAEAGGKGEHLHAALVLLAAQRAVGMSAALGSGRLGGVAEGQALERSRAEHASSGHRSPPADERPSVQRARHLAPPSSPRGASYPRLNRSRPAAARWPSRRGSPRRPCRRCGRAAAGSPRSAGRERPRPRR